jgi:hypothetical protein
MGLQLIFDSSRIQSPDVMVAMTVVVMGAVGIFALASKQQPHAKAAALLMALVTISLSLWNGARYWRLQDEIDRGSISQVTGVFQRTSTNQYSIGSEQFHISGASYPGLHAEEDWLADRALGRCVEARYTSERKIVWLAESMECDELLR